MPNEDSTPPAPPAAFVLQLSANDRELLERIARTAQVAIDEFKWQADTLREQGRALEELRAQIAAGVHAAPAAALVVHDAVRAHAPSVSSEVRESLRAMALKQDDLEKQLAPQIAELLEKKRADERMEKRELRQFLIDVGKTVTPWVLAIAGAWATVHAAFSAMPSHPYGPGYYAPSYAAPTPTAALPPPATPAPSH